VNKLVVAQSVQLGSRANPHDPKRPVLPLPLFPAAICKLEAALYGFFRGSVEFRFSEEVSARAIKYFLALGAAFGSAFYTWHGFLLFAFYVLAAGGKDDSPWRRSLASSRA
jgi:hypothetical protein